MVVEDILKCRMCNSEKLELFLDSPELGEKMGIKARENVISNFDLEKHHEKMRQHLLSWIKNKNYF